MKKDGFTLIEMVVSIFILTILFNVGISLNKFGSNLLDDMKNTACVYEIQNILSYGKAVCRDKNKYGKITVDSRKNEIRFVAEAGKIEKIINLPKEISIVDRYTSILITPDGKISNGTTIALVDEHREKQDITIGVSVDLIVIKDGKFV